MSDLSPMERAVRFEIRGHIEAILKEAQGRVTPGSDGWPVVAEAVLTHWSDALAHMVFHRLEGHAVLGGRVVELEEGRLCTATNPSHFCCADFGYRVKQHTEDAS